MMIGLDKTFKPQWVYKLLKLSKPGLKFKELEPEFLSIIEFEGVVAKKKVLTIIKRYFLETERINGIEYFKTNHLHNLVLKYSHESVKPILLFVLLNRCEIARTIQIKINLMFGNNSHVDVPILLNNMKKKYGDRTIIRYAVSYYLTILSYFDVLFKKGSKYTWRNKTLPCTSYILKEMILLYAKINNEYEIDIPKIKSDIVFSLFDLSGLEDVLREFNSKVWKYQKRLDSNKVIILTKV